MPIIHIMFLLLYKCPLLKLYFRKEGVSIVKGMMNTR